MMLTAVARCEPVEWQHDDIYQGMLQFMGLQLVGLLLVIAFREIAIWLPEFAYGR